MTTRPLIIEQTPDPWSIVDSPWGRIEAWRASTLATGTMGALAQVYDIVRSDSATAVERTAAVQDTMDKMQALCDMIDNLHQRMDAFAAKQEAIQLKHRAEAEAKAKQDRFDEELALPPGTPSNMVNLEELIQEDDTLPTSTYTPGGELHAIPAKGEPVDNTLPTPPEDDAERGVPLSYGKVPMSYVHSEPTPRGSTPPGEQQEFTLPEPEPPPDPQRGVVPQPIGLFGA
jgi:hypothetical protein